MKIVIAVLYFWGVLLCIIEVLNNQNILIVESIFSDIQEICFHHHHQACLIHYFGQDQTHMIQCTIRVRPGCYKPDQTCLTQIKRNPDDSTRFQPGYVYYFCIKLSSFHIIGAVSTQCVLQGVHISQYCWLGSIQSSWLHCHGMETAIVLWPSQ